MRLDGWKRLTAWGLMLAMLVLLPPAVRADDDQPAPQSYRLMCAVNKKETGVPVYAQPGTSGTKIAILKQGDEMEVVGDTGSYYRVLTDGQTGYVARSRVRLVGRERQDALPECMDGTLALEDPIPKMYTDYLTLKGEIRADRPIDTVFAFLWDEKQFRVEQAWVKALGSAAKTVSAGKLKGLLNIGNVKGGRKTLVIQGSCQGEMVVLMRSPVYIRGAQDDPASVSAMCGGLTDVLLDTKVSTAYLFTKTRTTMSVTIPEAAKPALMTIEWKVIPDSFTVELFGEGGKALSSETYETRRYADWLPLTKDVRTVKITPRGGNEIAISSCRVYSDTYSRHAVQQWEDMPDKLDMLVVSTHQDDEFLFLGGTIPYYAWRQDVTMGVMYMTEGERVRMKEALDGLWTAGVRYYPILLELEDKYTLNPKQAAGRWKKSEPQVRVVRVLRQYKPEVIVCQDFNGEYGHGQHMYTVELLAECLALANDPAFDPESAEKWGVWQVKKMYSHLYDQNQIVMAWDQPLDSSGVVTAMFLAKEAYDKHHSQQSAFSMEWHGVKYDNTLFGLYYSAVGPDVEKNDFMENIR